MFEADRIRHQAPEPFPENLSRELFVDRSYSSVGRESLSPWSELMAEVRKDSRNGFTARQNEAYEAFSSIASFMRMSSAPLGPCDPLVYECIERAKEHLDAQGVKVDRRLTREAELLVISAAGDHLLNRIANGLHRWHDGLKLYYDPRSLENSRALALYYTDQNRISLPHDFLLNVHRLKDDFMSGFGHEVQHSLTARDLRLGMSSPYYGLAVSRVNLPINAGGYDRALHFDELKTHSFDARRLEKQTTKDRQAGLAMLQSSLLIGICERGWKLSYEVRAICDMLADKTPRLLDPHAWIFEERKETVTKSPIVYGRTFAHMRGRRVDVEIPLVSSPGISISSRWPFKLFGSDEKRASNLELMGKQVGKLREAADRHRAEFAAIARRHVMG